MADDPKDVALALLLGWEPNGRATGGSVAAWMRPMKDNEPRPSPYGRVWLWPPGSFAPARLNALSASAAVAYDTK